MTATDPNLAVHAAFSATRFVGRTRELARMEQALEDARAGKPGVILLAGEAGAGKSTLLAELFRRAETSTPPFACLIAECSAMTGVADPYLPFREIPKLLTGDSEVPRKTSAPLLAATGKLLLDNAPDLLSIFIPGSKLLSEVGMTVARAAGWLNNERTPAKLPTELDQEKIFRQYTEVLQSVTRHRPLVVALDDLQWADASSIALFFHLARQVKQAKLL